MLAIGGLFVEPLKRLLTGLLDGLSPALAKSVPTWLNHETVALASYAGCGLLFIAGSLLYPDEAQPLQKQAPLE